MYQPALLPQQILALYLIKTNDGRPMTFHSRRAVDEYPRRYPEIQELASQATSANTPDHRRSP